MLKVSVSCLFEMANYSSVLSALRATIEQGKPLKRSPRIIKYMRADHDPGRKNTFNMQARNPPNNRLKNETEDVSRLSV